MLEWMSACAAVSLSLSLLLLLILATYFLYSGLFAQVIIFTGYPPIKNVTFVYKLQEGPHKNRAELFKEASRIGPNTFCMGVFYDDPKKVSGHQCRYAVGSIVSEGKDKVDEDLLKLYETSGFHVFSFPEVTHVVIASVPHRNFLSVLLGVKRVYPRLERYIKERKLCAHPFLEIYREGLIHFMAPLARQGDFYVPEVRLVKKEHEEFDSDTDVSGADSNSECSSGVLLSDSRETSLSSVRSESVQDREDRSPGGAGASRGRSFRGLNWEQTEREDERLEQLPKHNANLYGLVGGEE
ncbi:testis-expressed protein 264 homolog isoform X1 [Nerophis lumbriciformis]|uniref:testis-expressed protein 264 homolog isoform X1 n=1 Tax=Nerophis lumbriciformis TaxID=546530 RepID=UPI002AE02B6D|nr:testis-expressed protein 264 homolog isoform X1 [Nerophis lumbriciformis]